MSNMLTRLYGWIPEWPKGTDCKSAANCFGGSNPPPSILKFNIAGWSSLEARRAHNPEVIGSNPVPATRYLLYKYHAQIAQLVEQRTENPRVAGSIPALGTTCGHSSSGRAPPCQGGGSEFEPRRPLHFVEV